MPIYIIRCTRGSQGPLFDERKRWEQAMVIAGHPDGRETDFSKALFYTDRTKAELFCNLERGDGSEFEVVTVDLVERKGE